MTLKAAKEAFEHVQEVTANQQDVVSELMAQAMVELTDSLRRELKNITSKIEAIERRVG